MIHRASNFEAAAALLPLRHYGSSALLIPARDCLHDQCSFPESICSSPARLSQLWPMRAVFLFMAASIAPAGFAGPLERAKEPRATEKPTAGAAESNRSYSAATILTERV